MPRTSTQDEPTGDEASAWPSMKPFRGDHARHLQDALDHILVIGERGFDRLDEDMTVEAEKLRDELLAETVHHRHDDDQGRNAEHHTDEGKNGDDGDEAVLAARAQIAKRQHALDGRKGARRAYGVGGHARLRQFPDAHACARAP